MMIHTVGERACQQTGEVHEFVQSIMRGTPTADQMQKLLIMVRDAEQLTDATARGIALLVASVRLGPDAQRTKRLVSEWRDVENLPAVQKMRETKRVVKLKRKSSKG